MPISPNRKLVYDFLDLPHHTQYAIARELGLAVPRIMQADDSDTFRRWFKECNETGKLARLRELVAREKSELEETE